MALPLRSFPFLSPAEFKTACRSFEERYRDFLDSRRGLGTQRGREYDNDIAAAALDGWSDVRVEERVCR